MKKQIKSILYFSQFIFLLLFYGCPYYNDFPIDEANVRVNDGYLGKWELMPYPELEIQMDSISRIESYSRPNGEGMNKIYGGDTNKTFYEISKKNDFIYQIKSIFYIEDESNSGKEKTSIYYDAHISIINNIEFLNLKSKNDDNTKDVYYYYRIYYQTNKIVLRELSPVLNSLENYDGLNVSTTNINSSRVLKEIIANNINNKNLYWDSIVLFKTTPDLNNDSFINFRDNKVYKTIKIGNQTWMAENYAFKSAYGCWLNNDDNFNGYLYNYYAAKYYYPPGWHLPSYAEWLLLFENLGYIKENNYFILSSKTISLQESFFSLNLKFDETWWTSSSYGLFNALYTKYNNKNNSIIFNDYSKLLGCYVRYIRDY